MISFNEAKHYTFARSSPIRTCSPFPPVITDGGEKVNNRGVLIRRVESRDREKERQKKKERKGERLKGKTGTWRVEIQDLSRNPRSRTPFSEAAQKDKSGGEGRADFS